MRWVQGRIFKRLTTASRCFAGEKLRGPTPVGPPKPQKEAQRHGALVVKLQQSLHFLGIRVGTSGPDAFAGAIPADHDLILEHHVSRSARRTSQCAHTLNGIAKLLQIAHQRSDVVFESNSHGSHRPAVSVERSVLPLLPVLNGKLSGVHPQNIPAMKGCRERLGLTSE